MPWLAYRPWFRLKIEDGDESWVLLAGTQR